MASHLISLSFEHYRYSIRDKLLRYKQLLFVITILLFPTVDMLCGVVVMPLRALFLPASPLSILLATLIIYQLLAMFWARLQRDAIICESVAAFINSLPIHGAMFLIRDAALLLLSTSLLFVPLAIAFGKQVSAHGLNFAVMAMLIFTIISATAAQLISLYCWRPGYILLLAATTGFAASAVKGRAIGSLGEVVCLLLLLLTFYRLYFHRGAMIGLYRRSARTHATHRDKATSALISIVKLNSRALYHERESGYKLTVAVSMALMALTNAIFIARSSIPPKDVEAVAICVPVAIMVALFSMSYATLFTGRRRYAGILSSLPLTGRQWVAVDIMSVQALPLALTGFLSIAWWWLSSVAEATALLPLATVAGLGTVNYFIYRHQPRHAIALSLLALVVWLFGCSWLEAISSMSGKLAIAGDGYRN